MLRKKFANTVMKWSGWTLTGEWPVIDKGIMLVAPHTSLWDWVWGLLGYWSNGKKANFLIKSNYFFFPLNNILRATGGIPVNAGKDKQFIQNVVSHVKQHNQLYLTITPEGTRKKVRRWRLGFYTLAMELSIPILISKIDYKNKKMVLMTIFYPTGDREKDLMEIYSYYTENNAKHPERFQLPDKYHQTMKELEMHNTDESSFNKNN